MAALGAGLLIARVKPRQGLGVLPLLWVVAWLGFLSALDLKLLNALGISTFAWIHLRYLDLLIVLPCTGLLAIALARSGGQPARQAIQLPARILIGLSFSLVPVLLYASYIEPKRLVVESLDVQLGTPDLAPLRIALVADLQAREITDFERKAIQTANEAAPDLILISGDWLHADSMEAYKESLPAFRELLAELHAPLGVYMVQGNTEPFDWLDRLIQGTDVINLNERIVELNHSGRRIALGGLSLNGYRTQQGQAVVRALENQSADLRLLLAHKPDSVQAMRPNSPIDLLLAGHTHGGQVVVPFFGPPITLSSVPRQVARGGLHTMDGRRLYVSRGIGMERGPAPPMRFLAPPELTLLTVR